MSDSGYRIKKKVLLAFYGTVNQESMMTMNLRSSAIITNDSSLALGLLFEEFLGD